MKKYILLFILIIFISSQNDINITAKPPPKLVVSQGTSQNFSLIPPEVMKFQFYEPFHKSDNLDKTRAWYDSNIDLSDLPKGHYIIYIATSSNVPFAPRL